MLSFPESGTRSVKVSLRCCRRLLLPRLAAARSNSNASARNVCRDSRILPVCPLGVSLALALASFSPGESPCARLLGFFSPSWHLCQISPGGLGGSGRAPGRVGLTLSDMTNLSPVARRRCFPGLSSQTLCASTPASPRMRRRTLVVDYKEPSLSAYVTCRSCFATASFTIEIFISFKIQMMRFHWAKKQQHFLARKV